MAKGRGKFTEGKFKKFCTDNSIYALRLNDGYMNGRQPADYLIILRDYYLWCEVKEVESKNTYNFSRTTQELDLKLLQQINNNTKSLILIHFKRYKCIACLNINDYIELKNKSKTKSYLKLEDIPEKYLYKWKGLTEFFIPKK